MTPSSASHSTKEVSQYCKHCGYDLRGNECNLCPECGRGFDPLDQRTFSSRPPKVTRWLWIKRLTVSLMVLLVILGATWGWLYWGWADEQKTIAQLQHFTVDVTGLGVSSLTSYPPTYTTPLGGDRLQQLLGPGGFVLDRVTEYMR